MFDKDFIISAEETLGGETPELLSALDGTSSVSVRFNPYKMGSASTDVADVPLSGGVPWCRYGYYLAERPWFTADPFFHAGRYYVQEASSMFVGYVMENAAGGCSRILDLCAAPGGKTTLYSTLAGLEGLVVANEAIRSRVPALADNVRKWGLGNVVVTNNDPAHFGVLREWFDVVAVDAPCSGEGMFRKNPEARSEWSAANVSLSAARQRRILADAWEALAPGGTLIYSTCTFNRQENEDNVSWMAEELGGGDAGIEVPENWNVMHTKAGGISCFRFFPHRVRGEGLFCAAVRKGGQKGRPANPRPRRNIFSDIGRKDSAEPARWVAQPGHMAFALIGDNVYGYYRAAYNDIRTVSESMNAVHSGVCMGQMFGGKLKPDHSLAMFHDIARDAMPVAEVGIDDALRFLRKEDFPDPGFMAEGMNLVSYNGAPLGWTKRIGHRVNNLYPKSLMITGRRPGPKPVE